MKIPWRVARLDGHPIKTAITEREAAKLGELAAGKRVLEIGSAFGFSAVLMAKAGAQSVVCVDPHVLPDSLRIFKANIERHGVAERVTLEVAHSQVVLPRLRREGAEFDLIFVDGDHRRLVVEHDVYWSTLLLRDGGVLAVHDYDNEEDCPDVRPAVDWALSGCTLREASVTDSLWIASPARRARRRGGEQRSSGGPALSMVMIARNERENVRPCFESFWDHVDEVVLCDTGSRDGTIGEARRFARERGEPGKLIVGRFKWRDDFAAARNYADSLASGDWLVWCDVDDEIVGAEMLRLVAAAQPDDVDGVTFPYEYRWDRYGTLISLVSRERLSRASARRRWTGRVHETREEEGEGDGWSDGVIWRHRDRVWLPGRRIERDRRILEKWLHAEPDNPRACFLMGRNLQRRGQYAEAVEHFERSLAGSLRSKRGRRALGWGGLGSCLTELGRYAEAIAVALQGIEETPKFGIHFLVAAYAAARAGRHADAIYWARRCIEQSVTLNFSFDPRDVTSKPLALIARSLAALGRLDDAIVIAEDAFAYDPAERDGPLGEAYQGWCFEVAATLLEAARYAETNARAARPLETGGPASASSLVRIKRQLEERRSPASPTSVQAAVRWMRASA